MVKIADIDRQQVPPAIGIKSVARNREIADGRDFEKGQRCDVQGVADIEDVNTLFLFQHKKKRIAQEDRAGLSDGLRRQVADVGQGRVVGINGPFAHAAVTVEWRFTASVRQDDHARQEQEAEESGHKCGNEGENKKLPAPLPRAVFTIPSRSVFGVKVKAWL